MSIHLRDTTLGDLHVAGVGGDFELFFTHLRGDPGMGVASDGRELVAEVGVLSLEPIGQGDSCQTEFVGGDVAGVNVHPLRGLDGIFVRGIERVVDLEVLARGS